MRTASDSYVVDVLLAMRSQSRGANAVAQRLRRLTASMLDPYRAELHYMRGSDGEEIVQAVRAIARGDSLFGA